MIYIICYYFYLNYVINRFVMCVYDKYIRVVANNMQSYYLKGAMKNSPECILDSTSLKKV